MSRMHPVTVALVMAFCAACSKPDSTRSSGDSTDAKGEGPVTSAASACAIASREEMGDAIGAEVTATEEESGDHCIFRTAAALVYADVEIDRENADAAWEGVNTGDSTIGAQQDSLAGIGDSAFFGPRDRLYFRKSNAFVAVEGGFDDKARGRAIAIAKLVASKL